MRWVTLCTWFVLLVGLGEGFGTNVQPSSTPIASKWSINNLFNRANENSKTEDADSKKQEKQNALTTSISPRSRTTSDNVRGQRVNDPPTSSSFDLREGNGMMDPTFFGNPWALWGMRWANAWERSTRPPWDMWWRMNLAFWNQVLSNPSNGRGYGYGERYPDGYPGQYSQQMTNEGYRPGRYISYPDPESQRTYQSYNQPPSSSSYYRNQPMQYSSQPYYRGQRLFSNVQTQPAQPYYGNQRTEENIQSLPDTARVSQNYRQQSASSETNVQPPRSNVLTAREYREQSTNSRQSGSSVPFTLLYHDDPSTNSNVQSSASSEHRNQHTETNGQPERVETR